MGGRYAKKVLVAGLLGGIVLVVWTFVVNGVLGFNRSINMKQVPNERQVYTVLKENIVKPGKYVCNPELTLARTFPDEEPAFSIQYGGTGHGSAGVGMLVGLASFFLAPTIGTWMLSTTSAPNGSSYPRKVFFFTAIGLSLVIVGDLGKFGPGGYPSSDVLTLAVHDVVAWTFVGLVVAWRIKPEPGSVMDS